MRISSAVTADHRGLEDGYIYKSTLTGLFAALSHVVFIFLQIKITLPGGDATSIHLGNTVCVLRALILGGFYGGLGEALGMIVGGLSDPIYVVYAPKTLLLKPCIGLITGLVAHRIDGTNESSDRGHVFYFMVAVSVCDLLFNMISDPLADYYYKLAILGRPTAELVPVWNTASTSIDAMMFAAAVVVIYMSLRSILIRAGFFDQLRWQET